jgi:two-component system nitrogen regulation sensor histidine kinase NtrY
VSFYPSLLKRWRERFPLIPFLLIVTFFLSILTYRAFSYSFPSLSAYAITLVYVDIFGIFVLCYVIGQRLVALWIGHKKKLSGTRLQGRFVVIFSLLTVIPSLSITLFATIFLHETLDSWFTENHQQALQEALQVAELSFKEHQEKILTDAFTMARLLETSLPSIMEEEDACCALLTQLSSLKSFSEAILFSNSLEVRARTPFSYALEFERIQRQDLEQAFQQYAVLLKTSPERLCALIGLNLKGTSAFLLVGRDIDPSIVQHKKKVQNIVQDYRHTLVQWGHLEINLAIMFFVVSLFFVFCSVVIALNLSSRIVHPIVQLVSMANRIKNRDLSARIPLKETHRPDELHFLQRTFNRMAEQLQEQHQEILQANSLLEDRQKMTESILASASSGIISIDAEGKIRLLNKAALSLLGLEETFCVGESLRTYLPELAALIKEKGLPSSQSLYESEISLTRSGKTRLLLVRFAPTYHGEQFNGGVMTLDDLTEFVAIQKKAAWSDVARHLAHEIKNPLTPIQLAIERLSRKYKPQITSELEIFTQLTQTVERQVANIRKLLDEFSRFARFPEPMLRSCDLAKLCTQIVFLAQTTYPHLHFVYTKSKSIFIKGDEELLQQAFLNIVQNAVNALSQNSSSNATSIITLRLTKRKGVARLSFCDNGPGFPASSLSHLVDPYITFSQGGTGLGLAVVNKIIQGHGGTMVLRNRKEGAEVLLTFPLETNESA